MVIIQSNEHDIVVKSLNSRQIPEIEKKETRVLNA